MLPINVFPPIWIIILRNVLSMVPFQNVAPLSVVFPKERHKGLYCFCYIYICYMFLLYIYIYIYIYINDLPINIVCFILNEEFILMIPIWLIRLAISTPFSLLWMRTCSTLITGLHSFFYIRIYFIRISRLKFAKF